MNQQIFKDPFDADKFNETYNCSECWGILVKVKQENGEYACLCENCKDGTKGYVTRKYIERYYERNILEAMEARIILKDYLPKCPKQTETQIMQELGF